MGLGRETEELERWHKGGLARPTPSIVHCIDSKNELEMGYISKADYHYSCCIFLLFVQVWLLFRMNRFCACGSNYNLITALIRHVKIKII